MWVGAGLESVPLPERSLCAGKSRGVRAVGSQPPFPPLAIWAGRQGRKNRMQA